MNGREDSDTEEIVISSKTLAGFKVLEEIKKKKGVNKNKYIVNEKRLFKYD